jgi:hypothetical protein
MMKRQLLVPFLVLLTLLCGCKDEREQKLCKVWQMQDVIFLNEQEATVQSDTMQGNMQKVTKAILRDVLMKNIYQFNADGTYKTGNAAASSTGKWELEGQAIRFISDVPQTAESLHPEKVIPLEKLEDDSLILLMTNDQTSFQMKLVMVPLR